ncbi:MAG: TIGR02679 family protein [Clostridia bacterium]
MNAKPCAEYFRAHSGYKRILDELLRKYRGLGRVGGAICLTDASQAELDAARALFGHPFDAPLRLRLSDFEAALQATPYAGVTLPELLEAYFDCLVPTKSEEKAQKLQTLTRAVEAVHAQSELCRCWLEQLLEHRQAEGYRLLCQYAEAGMATQALERACASMDWLCAHRGQPVRLAVLSAQATSDPHALDGTAPAGKLLLHLLAFAQGTAYPATAEERDSLLFCCGVLCDSISSTVAQVGLVLQTEAGEHPAFAAFRKRHELCTLTLSSLLPLVRAESLTGRVYLVENQMVFSQLCDRAAEFHSPLVCTSGQPQVAVLRLLDLLAASGASLYYSGDFDGNGLGIATQLLARYPQQLTLWHMRPEDYALACSTTRLEPSRLAVIRGFLDGAAGDTASAMLRRGYAGYQELLLAELWRDLVEGE